MGPAALAQVLRPIAALFPASEYGDLLVGLGTADDAAVYRVAEDKALVVTADFFPPVVDDPYDYGAVAAANAMSDVFAMGGEVMLALNLAAFPADLAPEVITAIVLGGAEAVLEAGGVVAGGHTLIDSEPKYGLAVVGKVAPDAILRKDGARPGDRLFLTKPIGTGVITTALKEGTAADDHVATAVAAMRRLNRGAARAAARARAHAVTDVTGFGLAGHAAEMATHSRVALHLRLADIPVLPGAMQYATAGSVPEGTARNMDGFPSAVGAMEAPAPWPKVLFDPQTSGGLLVAVASEGAQAFAADLAEGGCSGQEIGVVRTGEGVHLD